MKRFYLCLISLIVFVGCNPSGNVSKNSDPSNQQEEEKIWANISDGDQHLNPGDYSHTLTAISLQMISESRNWSGSAWKNDYVCSRLDILTYDKSFPQAKLEMSDLKGENGSKIPKENITATYLNSVDSKSEAYPEIDYKIYDIISRNTVRDLETESVYAAWIEIYVPKNTPKGKYKGALTLKSEKNLLATINYELEVSDMTLTEPEEWETFLDLWQTPFASNRHYSGKSNMEFFNFTTPERQDTNPFSLYYVRLDSKYQAGLESELELYHKAGGNCISVHTVEAPDNSRFPCATPSMIKMTRKKDGTFSYDYTDMDYWVELCLKHGINRQISLFYHTGVGYGFVYYDEAKGTVCTDLSGHPGSEQYKKISADFLPSLAKHLEEKGWFDMAVLYMDERLYDVTKAMIEVAESVKNSKGVSLKAGGAVNGSEVEPLYDRMYDVSMWENSRTSNSRQIAVDRRAKGLQTTIYTCGSGKMSSCNEPAEAAYAVYDAKQYQMDGVMRWALNKYDEDPLHATLHTTCYPGDCYLIYPDEKDSPAMQAQSSPRFEKLCEGMRMVEKLNLIKKNHPEYAEAVEKIFSSLSRAGAVPAVQLMRTRVSDLSTAVQNGEPAPAI